MRQKDEEIVNAKTHFVSFVFCVACLIYVTFSQKISISNKIGFLPMIITSGWTFLSSYIYHIEEKEKQKERNRKLDKSAIYLMILGCGITTCLTATKPMVGIMSSLVVVALVLSSLVGYCSFQRFPEWLSVCTYISIGWIAALPGMGVFGPSLYTENQLTSYLISVGILYCLGVIFYSWDSVKWFHTVWHLFVMAASSLHIVIHILSVSA